MTHLSATELAQRLEVSKGRVSQWVKEGKLNGCYTGDGRARRFDLTACLVALGRNLDTAQGLGNGRKTLNLIGAIEDPDPDPVGDEDADEISDSVKARYDLARTMRIEEQARSARYDNHLREGTLVLASEVERAVMAQIGQEVAGFENVLRKAARVIAETYDLKAADVRRQLIGVWREHRRDRSGKADARAASADRSETEKGADF